MLRPKELLVKLAKEYSEARNSIPSTESEV